MGWRRRFARRIRRSANRGLVALPSPDRSRTALEATTSRPGGATGPSADRLTGLSRCAGSSSESVVAAGRMGLSTRSRPRLRIRSGNRSGRRFRIERTLGGSFVGMVEPARGDRDRGPSRDRGRLAGPGWPGSMVDPSARARFSRSIQPRLGVGGRRSTLGRFGGPIEDGLRASRRSGADLSILRARRRPRVLGRMVRISHARSPFHVALGVRQGLTGDDRQDGLDEPGKVLGSHLQQGHGRRPGRSRAPAGAGRRQADQRLVLPAPVSHRLAGRIAGRR